MRLVTLSVLSGMAAIVAAATAGCGGAQQQPEKIMILCGNSFRPPMEKLAEMYKKETGQDVEMSFGGCESLFPQVELKAKGDVFVAHTPYQQKTKDAGALLREVPVGSQAPVLVVRKGNPKNIKSIEDLARPGLKVVLTDPQYSTCGPMVFKLLEKKGIKDQVLKNVGDDLVRDHADVGNQLQLGVCDAGIMWNGVAHGYLDSIEIVPGPYEYDETINLSVMGLSYSKKKEEVNKFLDFVEKHGRKVFADFGYVKGTGEEKEKQ
jgi:molybdate transport system substrate-binding protein